MQSSTCLPILLFTRILTHIYTYLQGWAPAYRKGIREVKIGEYHSMEMETNET